MANIMKEVANSLGVELGEEFRIEVCTMKYQLSETGLEFWSDTCKDWCPTYELEEILTGVCKIIKPSELILDDVEKEYLSNVIKPFRNRILYIAKSETVKTYDNPNPKIYECIYIMYKDSTKKRNPYYMGFPHFEKGTMYKGMELNKEYTLEELGL